MTASSFRPMGRHYHRFRQKQQKNDLNLYFPSALNLHTIAKVRKAPVPPLPWYQGLLTSRFGLRHGFCPT